MRRSPCSIIQVTFLSVLTACSVGSQYGSDTTGYNYARGTSTAASKDAPALALPFAPWPPPVPSARITLNKRYFEDRKRFQSVGDVGDYWERLLSSAGYNNFGYYLAPGGFAIVTPMESVDAAGRPQNGEARWVRGTTPLDSNPIKNWFLLLWKRPVGYYRVLIIFVTTDPSPPDQKKSAGEETISRWVSDSMPSLPIAVRDAPMTRRHICYINLYEIQKEEDNEPRLLPATVDVLTQLRQTGIALTGRAS